MDWLRKHADSVAVIGSIVLATVWTVNSIHGVKEDLSKDINRLEKEISKIDKEVAVMKAVMITKGVMNGELASQKN